jgi:hypothetical protein
VLLGIQRLAQNSQQKIAMLSRKSELLSHSSAEIDTPPLEYKAQQEGLKQLDEKTNN